MMKHEACTHPHQASLIIVSILHVPSPSLRANDECSGPKRPENRAVRQWVDRMKDEGSQRRKAACLKPIHVRARDLRCPRSMLYHYFFERVHVDVDYGFCSVYSHR